MQRDFLTLTEICLEYFRVIIEGSVFVGDIEKLFIFKEPKSEISQKDIDYFDFFEKHSIELFSLLDNKYRIFTNPHSMSIYYNAISKMHNKLEKELKISDKEYRDRFAQILLNHRKSYKTLSNYVVRLDGKTFSNVREISSQFEIPVDILSLFKLGLERHDRNSSVAIITNNNKFQECVNQTENSPPVYIGNSFQLDPFYHIYIK